MMLIRPNYQQYYPFNLDGIDSAECKAEFHVEKADLPRLPEALQKRVKECPIHVGIVTRFLDLGDRYLFLSPDITNHTLDYIYENLDHL